MCLNFGVNIPCALLDMLNQYKSLLHAGPRKSPAELLFKFEPRCKLDFTRPFVKWSKSFSVGKKVRCRDYIGSHKWCFGIVVKHDGKLHNLIELENGKVWIRHESSR